LLLNNPIASKLEVKKVEGDNKKNYT